MVNIKNIQNDNNDNSNNDDNDLVSWLTRGQLAVNSRYQYVYNKCINDASFSELIIIKYEKIRQTI